MLFLLIIGIDVVASVYYVAAVQACAPRAHGSNAPRLDRTRHRLPTQLSLAVLSAPLPGHSPNTLKFTL